MTTRFTPTPTEGIKQLSCKDCIPEVSIHFDETSHTLLGIIAHERTCPWLNQVHPEGTLIDCRHGVLGHAYLAEVNDETRNEET